MRITERIVRLEKAIPCDLIAFFSVPEKYSENERTKIENDLRNEYLKSGGNEKAYPAYIAGLTGEKEPMFLCTRKRADVLSKIQEAGQRRMASMKG